MTDAAFDIAAGGMAAERSAMDAIAQNLATGGAAGRTRGESGAAETAFVPVSFSSALDDALSTSGLPDVEMSFGSDIQLTPPFGDAAPEADFVDDSPAPPAAAASGGDPIGQMIALVATGRAYDADVAALQAAKQMDVEASDIDKF
jgi:flagellar basal body rod protein FlgC